MRDAIDFTELKNSGALPSPNGVGLAIMRLCQHDLVSMQELVRLIQGDPVIAGRIIKIANAANRTRSRPIASITTDVLILVGIQSVRQVALGLSLLTSYRNGNCDGFDYQQFWSRSIALACAAQAAAFVIRTAPAAEMFTCGLLADIGRLALASARPAAYSRLLAQHAGATVEELAQAETRLFAFNHRSLSAAMMADWNLPKLFSDAVLFHENPDASGFAEESRQQKLTRVMHFAALIADACVAAPDARAMSVRTVIEAGERLHINADQVAMIADQAAREWTEWGDVLELRTHALSPLLLDEPTP